MFASVLLILAVLMCREVLLRAGGFTLSVASAALLVTITIVSISDNNYIGWQCNDMFWSAIPETRCVNSRDGGRSSASEFYAPVHATPEQLGAYETGIKYSSPGKVAGSRRCLYGHTDIHSAARANSVPVVATAVAMDEATAARANWTSGGGQLCPHKHGWCGVSVNRYNCTCVSPETAHHAETDWVSNYATMADFFAMLAGLLFMCCCFCYPICSLGSSAQGNANGYDSRDDRSSPDYNPDAAAASRRSRDCWVKFLFISFLVVVLLWLMHREEEDYWIGCGASDHLDTLGYVAVGVGFASVFSAYAEEFLDAPRWFMRLWMRLWSGDPRGNMV